MPSDPENVNPSHRLALHHRGKGGIGSCNKYNIGTAPLEMKALKSSVSPRIVTFFTKRHGQRGAREKNDGNRLESQLEKLEEAGKFLVNAVFDVGRKDSLMI